MSIEYCVSPVEVLGVNRACVCFPARYQFEQCVVVTRHGSQTYRYREIRRAAPSSRWCVHRLDAMSINWTIRG